MRIRADCWEIYRFKAKEGILKVTIPALRISALFLAALWVAALVKVISQGSLHWLPNPIICFVIAYLGGSICAFVLSSRLQTTFPAFACAVCALIAPVITLLILACIKRSKTPAYSPSLSYYNQRRSSPQPAVSLGSNCPYYFGGYCRSHSHSEGMKCSLQEGSYLTNCHVYPILKAQSNR
jgi:hypothetical protein